MQIDKQGTIFILKKSVQVFLSQCLQLLQTQLIIGYPVNSAQLHKALAKAPSAKYQYLVLSAKAAGNNRLHCCTSAAAQKQCSSFTTAA